MDLTEKHIPSQSELIFLPVHIDAARNSTDDFNLFHDKNKWQQIKGNPFSGPIALGFQLECLIESCINDYRISQDEYSFLDEMSLWFSNYQYTFAGVVKPGQKLRVDIRPSQRKTGDEVLLGNRVALYADDQLALRGYKKETKQPLYMSELVYPSDLQISDFKDRSYINGSDVFVKLKYLNTGNAKNFLCGSLVEQSDYIDEIEDTVCFPESFPAALISCALLERARVEGHDFEADPMVYTSHKISIDRRVHEKLASNDLIALLVSAPEGYSKNNGLGNSVDNQRLYHCQCRTRSNELLFSAQIAMASLASIIKNGSKRHT